MKTRVAIIETTGNVIRRYGTQSVMKLILNQPIMRKFLKNVMKPAESDGLIESATEESAKKSPNVQDEPVKRARKGLRKYKSLVRKLKFKVNDKVTNSKVVKSKATAVVMSLAKVSRLAESGQGDGAMNSGGEKETQMPLILLARLTSTISKSRKKERTLTDTKLELDVISKCGSDSLLNDYKPFRTNTAKMKLDGRRDVVEYSRITVPESFHMGDPCWWLIRKSESKQLDQNTRDGIA